mmetsp:Transcript_89301/g.161157  ORF Transcript_89301/g.161157 Transcript_89301/m.161157 type:complete len:299 (+) Transcript_89301:986-1882(+)
MHAGTTVHKGPICAQRRPLAQLAHEAAHALAEVVVDLVVDNEALWAGAVLPHVLEGAADHQLREGLVHIRVVADHERVLAPELQDNWSDDLSAAGSFHDLAAHGHAADKDNLVSMLHDGSPCLRVARDQLDQVWGRARSFQTSADSAAQVACGPRRELRDLDHDGVAGEDGRDHRVEDVVEGVVPGHDSAHHAHWHPLHAARLVRVHEPRIPVLWPQVLLAAGRSPPELLQGHRELAHHGVDHRLARLPAGHCADRLHVVQHEAMQGPKQVPPMREGGGSPNLLRRPCAAYHLLHIGR